MLGVLVGTVERMGSSDPIRVLHTLEPGFGWHFVSPDVHGMVGGATTYTDSRARAEYLVRVHLGGTDQDDQTARTPESVRFAHFVDEHATDLRPDDTTPLRPPV